MNIALIAHDEKKELMVQFCIAYCGVLSRNNLAPPAQQAKWCQRQQVLQFRNFLQALRRKSADCGKNCVQ